jgi:V8-like Glu-specific endopeptidase
VTNNHVLPDPNLLKNTEFRFNYQLTFAGTEEEVKKHKALEQKGKFQFHTNAELDYSVVELADNPGATWGVIPLAPGPPQKGARVNIIQHPAGLPKQISLQNNFVEYIDAKVVQYLTSTLPGSSGSPVFNDNWEAVAVHHAGGMLTEPGTSRRYFRNEGILIQAIVQDLPAKFKSKLSK